MLWINSLDWPVGEQPLTRNMDNIWNTAVSQAKHAKDRLIAHNIVQLTDLGSLVEIMVLDHLQNRRCTDLGPGALT